MISFIIADLHNNKLCTWLDYAWSVIKEHAADVLDLFDDKLGVHKQEPEFLKDQPRKNSCIENIDIGGKSGPKRNTDKKRLGGVLKLKPRNARLRLQSVSQLKKVMYASNTMKVQKVTYTKTSAATHRNPKDAYVNMRKTRKGSLAV